MKHKIKICLWASTQEHNVGVHNYGTEEENMNQVCDKVEGLLNKYEIFEIHRNMPTWTLEENVTQERLVKPDFVIDVHSNAGGGEGTEVFCNLKNDDGVDLAQHLYNAIAPISEGKDRGIKNGTHLYDIRKTKATTIIVELFFHDNPIEVEGWKNKQMNYAQAIVKGICDHVGILEHVDINTKTQDMINRIDDMIAKLQYIKANL